ncbi:hypothetical protein MCC01968_19540 [Bifidobacteriaceae bacterium MCC01968]|nr:hypothetical protein MCC01961_11500 [Bifidobacteriaceae bacterium MCC01961]GDZ70793.1 hypothetical protein MCC02039_18370 [Bifidobacteriaceae bacterium MCC02039]GDZ82747.1 hypothetical protein MCC01968_19540 [Bifidobacteriaceae bacterium MCC01968]
MFQPCVTDFSTGREVGGKVGDDLWKYLADFNVYIVLEGIDKIMGCSWNSKDNPLDVYESAAIIVWPHNSV